MRLNAATLFLVALVGNNGTTLAAQQTPPHDSRAKGEIVMVSPFNPAYPPLARQANITGDVELKLEIRQDGTIQSASVVVTPCSPRRQWTVPNDLVLSVEDVIRL